MTSFVLRRPSTSAWPSPYGAVASSPQRSGMRTTRDDACDAVAFSDEIHTSRRDPSTLRFRAGIVSTEPVILKAVLATLPTPLSPLSGGGGARRLGPAPPLWP